MPNKNPRTKVTSSAKDQGKLTVAYRDVSGHKLDALIVGPGSVSGLKLRLLGGAGINRVIDNVAAATGMKQTNVYFDRLYGA